MKKRNMIIAVIALLAIATFFVVKSNAITGNAVAPTGTVTIPLSELSSEAKYYEYDVDKTTVRFFAVKASDGSIRTAFDACDVCFDRKLGYRQEGDQMVCNNCGNKYSIDGIGSENKRGGGCWPGYLLSSVQGDKLIIDKADLAEGEWRFA